MTTTIESAATTIRTPRVEFEVDEAQLAAISFLCPLQGPPARGVPPRPTRLLPVGHRPGHRRARSEPCAHRAVPRLDGGPRARGLDDRPPAVDGLLLLPVRSHRRAHPLEPRPVRPPATGPPTDARGLDRSELGVLLFTAEQYDRDHAALAVLLGLNGLRVSEACATNIEDLGIERGHRTLRIVGKGNKPATVPLVPRTARTIDLAVGERHEGQAGRWRACCP